MAGVDYKDYIRTRITELRIQNNISEHRMSLDLGKSGSYIRSITNGSALPSVGGLLSIIEYFHMTPYEFFSPLDSQETLYGKICGRLSGMSDEELKKVDTFLSWFG